MTTNPSIWRIEGPEIVEQPTMKEPVWEDFINPMWPGEDISFFEGQFISAKADYQRHLASLRRYPHNLPDSLKGVDLIEGQHFRLQEQFLSSPPLHGQHNWNDCSEEDYHLTNPNYRRTIALPIPQPEQPISEEGTEVELMNCPFCGGRSIIEQTGNKQLTIKCTECTVQRTQKVLRYSLDWLRTTMISQWNARTPSREAVEERNNFAISFACWALYDPQAQSYLSAGITALGLLEKYLDRPYISTNTNQQ